MSEMLDELAVSKDEECLKSKKRYTKCDVLIVDDWLLEKIGGDRARELLEIVESRLRSDYFRFSAAPISYRATRDFNTGRIASDPTISS